MSMINTNPGFSQSVMANQQNQASSRAQKSAEPKDAKPAPSNVSQNFNPEKSPAARVDITM